MEFESFKPLMHHSWHNKLKPFIESKECDVIYRYLKKESGRGKEIAPLSNNVYRCFQETKLEDVKVVMMGYCPYHTFYKGIPVADGLLMGCSNNKRMQPSLINFYDAIERELYGGEEMSHPNDVSYLARQGVLMLNAALTTERNKPGSHFKLWEPFIKYLFENVLDVTGAPIIFLGKDASKYKSYAPPFTWTFELSHPASASHSGTTWESEGVFKAVNKILKENNNYEIQWMI